MAGIIPSDIKKERSHRLLNLGKEKTIQYLDRFVGEEIEVLFEHIDENGMLTGHTGNYMETAIEGGADLRGAISIVKVTERVGEKLYGKRTGHLCNR
jgi:threonylcarbamoyladenosine tRNA methylthiotransferase MtaB